MGGRCLCAVLGSGCYGRGAGAGAGGRGLNNQEQDVYTVARTARSRRLSQGRRKLVRVLTSFCSVAFGTQHSLGPGISLFDFRFRLESVAVGFLRFRTWTSNCSKPRTDALRESARIEFRWYPPHLTAKGLISYGAFPARYMKACHLGRNLSYGRALAGAPLEGFISRLDRMTLEASTLRCLH